MSILKNRRGIKTADMMQAFGDDQSGVEWRETWDLVDYRSAIDLMDQRIREIACQKSPELIWFLEHPPLYTAGTSSVDTELVAPNRFPVYHAGRGGRYTYHGPGQLICYIMLNLAKRRKDVRWFVHQLEGWLIRSLADLGIPAEAKKDRIGVWVMNRQGQEAKIAAIGLRIRRWITYHGFALNISPDLSHFSGIVPCGIRDFPVTSLADLSSDATRSDVIDILKHHFSDYFETATPLNVSTKNL